ncbi:MAG TPA: NADH-quinone oxidoreductase subunit C [Acidimicrobiales bacterium]|nr:NADH-quinone oxidoreductase subunit C [Acidimicrobiales bacterium]
MTDAAPDLTGPELLHGVPVSSSRGQQVLHPSREQYLDLMRSLADEGYAMCVDLCGVDYLEHAGRQVPEGVLLERFEVAVELLDLTAKRRTRIRVQVPADDATLPSLFDLYPGTEAMEREAFDMVGIVFDGHPDPSRILMPEDWIGHPLRKDYEVGRIPVQFKLTGKPV